MPLFVHITSEDIAKKVKRGGLRAEASNYIKERGVFAMPVTPNFQITHQWVREVKQWRRGQMVGIYFRIPDSELVWVGQYNAQHQSMTAAQALAQVMAQTKMTGLQVIIPRRVGPGEIVRIRPLPQIVGWRHYPEAHGRHPFACACCQCGMYNSRKIREKYSGK